MVSAAALDSGSSGSGSSPSRGHCVLGKTLYSHSAFDGKGQGTKRDTVGLEPGPLDPESSPLTSWPLVHIVL